MNAPRRPLVAVDWGTTSLRGALIDPHGQQIREHTAAQGILTVPAGEFATVFEANFGAIIAESKVLYPENPCWVLISGMAGSQQGWLQAPYCACPAGFEELTRHLCWITPPTRSADTTSIAIVPGLSCEHDGVPDVMRGEEVQVFGALRLLGLHHATVVLPGTHSKWVTVHGHRITGFRTYMTGEVFALLRQHSILSRTLPPLDAGFIADRFEAEAFDDGVAHALRGPSLLNTAFSTRSLSLFGRRTAPALASYLSGLVIGEELRAQVPAAGSVVVVIGSDTLTERYRRALLQCRVETRLVGSAATWSGLWDIAASMQP